MRTLKMKLKMVICCIATMAMMLNLAQTSAFADEVSTAYNITDATLFVDSDGNLGYNVVYYADTSNVTIASNSYGITNLTELKAMASAYAVTADLYVDDSGVLKSVSIDSRITRPTIGISWKSDTIGSDYLGFQEAFNRNGANAFFFPQFTSEEEANAYLVSNGVDGVFETGGSDVNPLYYGESELQTPHGSGSPNNDRDISDISLIRAAIKLDVPLLGVCRGEQIFNVAMGGGLIQDIPYYFGQKVLSGEIDVSRVTTVLSGKLPGSDTIIKDTGYTIRDFSTLSLGAKLGATYDSSTGTYLDGYGCDGDGHLRVWIDGIIHSGSPSYHELGNDSYDAIDSNSKWMYKINGSSNIGLVATAHHQAVNPDKLGTGLTIVAHSADGIVEGIEYQSNLFALGIQFHPERDALGDSSTAINNGEDPDQDTCNRFLRALVTYASVHDGSIANPDKVVVTEPTTEAPTEATTTEAVTTTTVAETTTIAASEETTASLSGSANTTAPSTGDFTNVGIFILLIIFALSAVNAVVIYKRK